MPKQRPKSAASKRTTLPLRFNYTNAFLKDWERLSHSGRYEMNRLKETIQLLIANTGPLPHPNTKIILLSVSGSGLTSVT